ncbi:MAG TPA: hypothetical protein VK211_20665 [Kamptonema sp.]|nr:hypothetical protein [Kamptonema sp.]
MIDSRDRAEVSRRKKEEGRRKKEECLYSKLFSHRYLTFNLVDLLICGDRLLWRNPLCLKIIA